LTTLKLHNSPQLQDFVKKFELNDPFEISIEDEMQLLAKGCLASYYGVQCLSEEEEQKFPHNLIELNSKVVELFSKVEPLE